ncbi:hypothetical protein THAOC_19366, partial [Thalassiosira oceanica]
RVAPTAAVDDAGRAAAGFLRAAASAPAHALDAISLRPEAPRYLSPDLSLGRAPPGSESPLPDSSRPFLRLEINLGKVAESGSGSGRSLKKRIDWGVSSASLWAVARSRNGSSAPEAEAAASRNRAKAASRRRLRTAGAPCGQ